MLIRSERPQDARPIRSLTKAAFAGASHASGREYAIIDALRDDGALTLSLVLEAAEGICAHLCFSAVSVAGRSDGWFGLGPVSVAPHHQGQGHGSHLLREGLGRLVRDHGARGCVVLGDPAFYARFGFAPVPGLTFPGVPAEYFMALVFDGTAPQGEVRYHPAFYA